MRAVTPDARSMTGGLEVVHAGPAQVERIAPLLDAYRRFYGLAPDPDLARRYLATRLAREESVVLLAQRPDGEAVGFVQLYPTFSSLRAARVFVLYDLFVVPEARRDGVARQLMEAAVAAAREAGAVALTLQTARTNLAAQRLYESLGWKRDEDFVEYGLAL
jgi:ribosomal protein S18 acetylase RimI-like enzyme